MGAFIYDTNGMLLFSGLDKDAAISYAELFELTEFTLVIREPRLQRHQAIASTQCQLQQHFLIAAQ